VCSGTTGHAEALEVEFDPSQVSFPTLVEFFLRIHDASDINGQGPDRGTQYRSGVYFTSEEQHQQALQVLDQVGRDHYGPAGLTIATELVPAQKFWTAEEYHQRYLVKNPGGYECPTHYMRW
ncbi:peptide-methionine (S)-S-oxide reductase, partial [Fonticula alba]